ncbi:MAG: WG repeat-containing protein [Zoogloeaceae bacterium]|jgi:hypothetical protein|nr:WG repeat-containing protein [Zoogloeaceae bacterium]
MSRLCPLLLSFACLLAGHAEAADVTGLLAQPYALRNYRIPLDHGGIHHLAFSPDGAILAAGGERVITFWDTKTCKSMHWSWAAKTCMPSDKLRGHADRIAYLAFSPDGKILASASADKTIMLWDVATRKALGEPLRGHEAEVRRLAFSPDGKTLASADSRQHIRLWDVAKRKQVAERKFDEVRVGHMIFSPDGEILILTDTYYDGEVFWTLAQNAIRREKRAVSCYPDRFALHLNDSTLAEVEKCADLGTLRGSARETNMAFSPDGKILANSRALWDMETRAPLGKLLRVEDYLTAPVFSPDGKMLAGVQGLGGNEILLFGGDMKEVPAPKRTTTRHSISVADADLPDTEIAAQFHYQGKYGIINARGKVVMPPIMRWIDNFNEDGLAFFMPDGSEKKYGVLDVFGNILVPPRFEDHAGGGWINGGARVAVRENGVGGAVDRNGNFSERVEIMVGGSDTWGVFDEQGEFVEVKGTSWRDDDTLSSKRAPSELVITHAQDAYGNSRYGLDDKAGQRIFPPIFTRLEAFAKKSFYVVETRRSRFERTEGTFFVFEKEGFTGLINREGRIIAHPEYNGAEALDDRSGNPEAADLVLLKKDGKLAFINQDGALFWLPCDAIAGPAPHPNEIRWRFNPYGLLYCRNNGKYGLINHRAELVLPTVFDAVEDFSRWGFAAVKRDGKAGLINARGQLVIPTEYDTIASFYGARAAWAKKGKREGMITRQGATLFTYGERCAREVIYGPDDHILWPPQTLEAICADAKTLPANSAQPGDTLLICARSPKAGPCEKSALCQAKVLAQSSDEIQVELLEPCTRYYQAGDRIQQLKSSIMPPEKRNLCEREQCFCFSC